MPTAWEPLLDRVRHSVERGSVPACQLAVARHGELQVFEALGDATTTDRFPAYSATKPIVAAAIWQLIGEGSLDVTSRIAELVPELSGPGMEAVTVEQVLLHTSGFPSAPMHPDEGADTARRRQRFSTWHTEWEPGSRFQYHPMSAHWVLADLLERADGQDFRDVIERRVTTPLGLPRLLGIPEDQQSDVQGGVRVDQATSTSTPTSTPTSAAGPSAASAGATEAAREAPSFVDPAAMLTTPAALAAGVPGGGGVMTAADLALFYQALLDDRKQLWDPDVLHDVTANIRCTMNDPLMGVAANRTLGLVVAGDDGWHVMRYACFGAGCSPAAFGHAGAHAQAAWADPASGVSFVFLHNAVHPDMLKAGARAAGLSSIVADLANAG